MPSNVPDLSALPPVLGEQLFRQLGAVLVVDGGQVHDLPVVYETLELRRVHRHDVGQVVGRDGDVEFLVVLRGRRRPHVIDLDAELIGIGARPDVVVDRLAFAELGALGDRAYRGHLDRRVVLAERIGRGFRLAGCGRAASAAGARGGAAACLIFRVVSVIAAACRERRYEREREQNRADPLPFHRATHPLVVDGSVFNRIIATREAGS
ncbi:hypothetical protein [Cohnella rhizosphaerae]|uniref:Uncharacterized protein n=1 Tax=Cohnella rhizosphaerae TaxID=1457232 RepID=A0A9X4QX21_9BACL|nr:hypothetical protein [Cohnella rhizosphaerae]MDG0814138.1 hypothetical protein [Cohnella rhizosphaerae]